MGMTVTELIDRENMRMDIPGFRVGDPLKSTLRFERVKKSASRFSKAS